MHNYNAVNTFFEKTFASQFDFDELLRICGAAKNENCSGVVIEWLKACDFSNKKIKKLVHKNKSKASLGTIIYHAKQCCINIFDKNKDKDKKQKIVKPKPKPKAVKSSNWYDTVCSIYNQAIKTTPALVLANPYFSRKTLPNSDVIFSDQIRVDKNNKSVIISCNNKQCKQIIRINNDGSKDVKYATAKEGEKRGAYVIASQWDITGKGEDQIIFIAEGISTILPVVSLGLGHAICALDAGNLKHVADIIKFKYPKAEITIIADNDESETGQKAAEATGCKYFLPPEIGTDLNDFWLKNGNGAVIHALLDDNETWLTRPLTPTINSRYLSDALSIDSLIKNKIFIKSTQETGKTKLSIDVIVNQIQAGKRGVVIAYSRCLVKSWYEQIKAKLGADFNVALYSDYDYDADSLFALTTNDIIITTLESAYKLQHFQSDFIVIDEFESVVKTLMSTKTHRHKLADNRHVLKNLIKKSETVLAVDADFSDLSKLFVHHTIDNAKWITNNYKHSNRVVTEFTNPIMLKHEVLSSAENGHKFALAVTSKRQAKQYAVLLEKFGNTLLVHGDNYETDAVQRLVTTKDATEYDYVVYTGALGTGVDINKHKFNKVYCLAQHVNGSSLNLVRQMMQRFRFINCYFVAYSGCGECADEDVKDKFPTDIDIIRQQFLEKYADDFNSIPDNKEIYSQHYDNNGLPILDNELLEEKLIYTKQQNEALLNWSGGNNNLLKKSGFKLIQTDAEPTETKSELIEFALALCNDVVLERDSDHVASLDVMPSIEHYKTAKTTAMSKSQYDSYQKTKIHIAYKDVQPPENNTEKLRNERRITRATVNPKKINRIISNVNLVLMSDIEFKVFYDNFKNKNTTWAIHDQFFSKKRKVFVDILKLIGFDSSKDNKKFTSSRYWSNDNCEFVIQFLEKHGYETKDPIKTFNYLLRNLGFIVTYTRLPGESRVYSVSEATIFNNIQNYIIGCDYNADEINSYLESVNRAAENYRNKNYTEPISIKTA